MKAAVLLAMLVAVAVPVTEALAEPACKTTTLKNAAPTLAEMYAMAERHAKAWKADAVVASIANTMLGPLQPDGSAASWHLVFYSASANSWVSIDTFRGSLSCNASAGSAGRIPNLEPGFVRDGALLYGIARQHGEALIANGHGVMIGTAAAPSNRHATWNVSYQKDGGKDGGVLVLVDANTGKVEKVLK